MSAASVSDTGSPAVARSTAGCRACARGMVPKRRRPSAHAPTVPGTVTLRGPVRGIRSWPCAFRSSSVFALPERPEPFRA